MDPSTVELSARVSPVSLLGYLNFSDGRPDPKFQRALDDAYAFAADRGDAAPWRSLRTWLFRQCDLLEQSGNAAFRETVQARAALRYSFGHLLTAYRDHHADLLAHQTDAGLFNPFFLVRVCEAVLGQGAPWEEEDRIVTGTLRRLNDFAGYRPIALLETRPQTEFYEHERFRPIPLYIAGAGACHGPYRALVEQTVEVLRQTESSILQQAGFDPNLLDELSMDPRAYDHGHPANRRPNYLFGEWDPHHIDRQGRFRRLVVRQAVLDALLQSAQRENAQREPSFQEQATVLAGTILMAAGMSGEGPSFHDSTVKLANLVPRIALYRDEFYGWWIARLPGELGERLRAEAKRVRQPFGGIRQHLNHTLAKQRAIQLQERRLAMLYAELGFPDASRRRAQQIPTASLRFLGEIRVRQSTAELAIHAGELRSAASVLPEVEDLIRRGIDCGALPDPWNILGYQGLYPLFQSKEDSVHDPRNEELIDALTRQFDLYARLLAGAAFTGDNPLHRRLNEGVQKLADWWDRFATYEVSDVPRLKGEERAAAAKHVADTLVRWREWKFEPSGSELHFWRAQREGFTSTAAFAQVVEALLREKDWNAALALLMTWLSEADTIALEEGTSSFSSLAAHWIECVLSSRAEENAIAMVRRFFELLEANAGELWAVPEVPTAAPANRDDDENEYASAYEGMSYQDSADDGVEGALAGGDEPGDFLLEEEVDRLEARFQFLAAVARFWRLGTSAHKRIGVEWEGWAQALRTARAWEYDLLAFIDGMLRVEVPTPAPGAYEDVIEFNHRRELRDHLAETALATRIEVSQSVWALGACTPQLLDRDDEPFLPWEASTAAMERALAARDAAAVRRVLPDLVQRLNPEPLLFVPLSEGGKPRQTLRARTAMALLESLFERLPRLGLLRETYHLLRMAKSMELNGPVEGPRKSDFDRLFRMALRKVVEVLLDAAVQWDKDHSVGTVAFTGILREVAKSFLDLWSSHSQMLRLSSLEALNGDEDWKHLRDFIRKYGRPLFTSHFMILGNLRGILHQGVGTWLDFLRDQAADEGPRKLLDDLENEKLERQQVVRWVEIVLHTIEENYEEYRDYNTTTTQSDYGDNLQVLLDFLRLKVQYDRFAWRMRPLALAHEVLCRKGHHAIAERWRENIGDNLKPRSEELLLELDRKEKEHALKLRTVRDRIEERFVQPLQLDRLCALVEPAARDARSGLGEASPAFRRLEEQLKPFVENPIGVGLDVPHWLRKLEVEVQRVMQAIDQPPATDVMPVTLSFADLQDQLAKWELPLA